MPRRIHRPTPTRMIESANGMRQPQTRKSLPDHELKTMTARVESSSPQGTPNCGHDGDQAALAVRARPFHRQQHGAAPLAADADTLERPQHGQDHRAPDADGIVGRHKGDGEGCKPHEQQRGDQGCLAADAIAVMAEYRGPDRSRGEADEIGPEGEKRRRQRVLVGEKQLAEDEPGRGAVEEKVVPLDCRADRRRDDGFAQLRTMFGVGQSPRPSLP